ncbi:MAG: (2Fe-2S)-binding protein [Saccharolobus sp.]
MNLPIVISKRHRRPRSIKDCEPGLPYNEEIINGKRISLCNNEIKKHYSRIRLPISNELLHARITRLFPSLVKMYSKYLINLPSSVDKDQEERQLVTLNVDNLIIGAGVSALGIISELPKQEKTIMIGFENNQYIIENDNSPIPQIKKEYFLKILKDVVKENQEKISNGIFIGKFDEGIGFITHDKLLIIKSKRVFLATGGRYIPPIFSGNDIPGVISKNLYIRYKGKIKSVIAIGNSDDAVKILLNVEGKRVLINNGILFLSKYYNELINELGIEIVKVKDLKVSRQQSKLKIIADSHTFSSEALVYAIVKQPKIDHSSNLGIDYEFNSYYNVYFPKHSINGKCDNNIYIAGGMRGISDEYTSFISGKAIVNSKYLDDLIQNLKDYTYIFDYYKGISKNSPSPYIYGNKGYLCECEDITLNDAKKALGNGYKRVEEIKRVTGLGTGECQGKFCSYLLGSLLKDNTLITFRSPLYRLVIY